MLSDLLISSQATTGLIIAAACIFGVALILYGVFRKFSQMGWLPWQIVIIFFVMMVVDAIPEGLKADVRLFVICAIFLIVTALVIGAGEAIRHAMHAHTRPAPVLLRVCDRILGGITGVLGLGVVLVAIAGFALPLCEHAIPPARDILSSIVFESGVWKAVSGRIFDFFLIALFVSVIHAGYRVGVGRGLLTLLMCILTLVAFGLAIFLSIGVPALRGMSTGIAKGFGENSAVGLIVGYGVSILIWFIILFTVFCLLGFLLHKLIRRIRYVRPFGIVGGIIMAIVFFAVMFLLASGIDAFVSWIADGGLNSAVSGAGGESVGNIISNIEGYLKGVADAITSSPISRAIYNGNLFRGLLPS